VDQSQLIRELAATVRRLEAKLALHELLGHYGRALDEWNWDLVRTIIHPEIVTRHDAVAAPMRGIEPFIGVLKSIQPKIRAAQHYITNTAAEVHADGETATVRAFIFAMHDLGKGKEGLLPAGGSYRMECVRAGTPMGWQIKEIEVTETWWDPGIFRIYDDSPMARAGHG
jgi:hypothetical protein